MKNNEENYLDKMEEEGWFLGNTVTS